MLSPLISSSNIFLISSSLFRWFVRMVVMMLTMKNNRLVNTLSHYMSQLVLSFVIIWILHIEFVTTKHVFIYQDKTFILKIT